MKKVLLILLLLPALKAFPDEGMWLPVLLKQLNESDMQSKGLKISAEDIYSINKTSLKDAVVLFGGGCTGEIISDQGLLLTNHHCGFSYINSHSSVKNNYLANGYWAKSKEEELSNPGLTVTFIIRMEDVTAKVNEVLNDSMPEQTRNLKIQAISKKLQADAVAGTHYEAFVRPFYNGTEFYLFVTEVFKDIRLVGAPPESIGKFGGETDNWVWPRHNADFCLFRIYAGKDNKPAPYSPDNVPYKPRYHIPISIKGEEENDFTMVYGFPGRTNEYLTSYAVDMIMKEADPEKIKLREKRLEIIEAEMAKSDSLRLRYATRYASVSNGYKKMMGEVNGLKKYNAIERKKEQERQFMLALENTPAKNKYQYLLTDIEKAYAAFRPLNKARDYFTEGIMSIDLLNHLFEYYKVVNLSRQPNRNEAEYQSALADLKKNSAAFQKGYNMGPDRKTFIEIMKLYRSDMDPAMLPEYLGEIDKKYKGDLSLYADKIFNSDAFVLDPRKTKKLFADFEKGTKKLEKDEGYRLVNALYLNYDAKVKAQVQKAEDEVGRLNKLYLVALREVMTAKKYYPDANSTLRVSYGKVSSYFPKDGTKYNYFTTLGGVMQKEKPGDDEFSVPGKLKELYEKKEYGRYADKDGQLHVAFIASNHTTGGNSGSPVFNGKGQLIGTNFDRNWEGTMSDIMYDPSQVRNIVLDVRYTLFIIEKFAGAKWLVDEMTIAE